ncbi:hypothetical protein INT46_010215 [Mucor plumbeus]|uniref:Uncharacterized protein n=1 Tax=Mucor plumbeus TaxID=97098 RepID=A0A8H7R460_9FUNG|nr:hypothetical protein INT46_010215 [Mucor plumbeus]
MRGINLEITVQELPLRRFFVKSVSKSLTKLPSINSAVEASQSVNSNEYTASLSPASLGDVAFLETDAETAEPLKYLLDLFGQTKTITIYNTATIFNNFTITQTPSKEYVTITSIPVNEYATVTATKLPPEEAAEVLTKSEIVMLSKI